MNDAWIVNLSDGSTHTEHWVSGELSPWQRLMDYCKKNRCHVTNLRLTIGQRTVSCPSNAVGYWQAHGMPAVQGIECLTGDSLVHTTSGAKQIRDIQAGEEVWSYSDGKFINTNVVDKVYRGSKDTLEIKMKNRSIKTSKDHRVLKLVSEKTNTRGNPLVWSLEWTAAQELSVGDYILSADYIPEYGEIQVSPKGHTVDEDYAFILGYMVGDGSVAHSYFNICEYDEGRCELISQIIHDKWGLVPGKNRDNGLTFFSTEISEDMIAMGLKGTAHTKYIPEIIWKSPSRIKRSFLSGYFDADGHLDSRGIKRYGSCNQALLKEVQVMHMELGDSVSNIGEYERKGDIWIDGRKVIQYSNLFYLEHYREPKRNNRTFISRKNIDMEKLCGDFSIQRIEKICEIGEHDLFDLVIDHPSHNYLAEGIINHNCDEELHKWRGIGYVEGDEVNIIWGARDPQTHQVIFWHDKRSAKGQGQIIWSKPQLHTGGLIQGPVPTVNTPKNLKEYSNKL